MEPIAYVMEEQREAGKRPAFFPVRETARRLFSRTRVAAFRVEAGSGDAAFVLACRVLPRVWSDGKKRRFLRGLREGGAPVWLEETLAARLGEPQPEEDWELRYVRARWLAARCGWDGEALVVLAGERAGDEDGARRRAFEQALLLSLAGNANYLTVVGGAPRDFAEAAQLLWQENGLPVRFQKRPASDARYGRAPLVLDFGEKKGRWAGAFSGREKRLDVYGKAAKFLDTVVRNEYNS